MLQNVMYLIDSWKLAELVGDCIELKIVFYFYEVTSVGKELYNTIF